MCPQWTAAKTSRRARPTGPAGRDDHGDWRIRQVLGVSGRFENVLDNGPAGAHAYILLQRESPPRRPRGTAGTREPPPVPWGSPPGAVRVVAHQRTGRSRVTGSLREGVVTAANRVRIGGRLGVHGGAYPGRCPRPGQAYGGQPAGVAAIAARGASRVRKRRVRARASMRGHVTWRMSRWRPDRSRTLPGFAGGRTL